VYEHGVCRCGGPAVASLVATWFCQACLDDERSRILGGLAPWGRPVGPAPVGYLPLGWVKLECIACSATWIGPARERCSWCAEAKARQHVEQTLLDRRGVTVPGFVWCPSHRRAWRGQPGEVCGAHGGPSSCNERSRPLPKREVVAS
jgi:hypothetical protein